MMLRVKVEYGTDLFVVDIDGITSEGPTTAHYTELQRRILSFAKAAGYKGETDIPLVLPAGYGGPLVVEGFLSFREAITLAAPLKRPTLRLRAGGPEEKTQSDAEFRLSSVIGIAITQHNDIAELHALMTKLGLMRIPKIKKIVNNLASEADALLRKVAGS